VLPVACSQLFPSGRSFFPSSGALFSNLEARGVRKEQRTSRKLHSFPTAQLFLPSGHPVLGQLDWGQSLAVANGRRSVPVERPGRMEIGRLVAWRQRGRSAAGSARTQTRKEGAKSVLICGTCGPNCVSGRQVDAEPED